MAETSLQDSAETPLVGERTAEELREERLPQEPGRQSEGIRPSPGTVAVERNPLRVGVKLVTPDIRKVVDEKIEEFSYDLTAAVNDVSRVGRTDLFELCCTETSALAQSVIDRGGTVLRMSLWNQYDFAKKTTVEKAKAYIIQFCLRHLHATVRPVCRSVLFRI